jgi:predicted PolB exonuclease-like 3'-5' exonuclease
MKKVIAFDLETVADPACMSFLPEIKAKSTLKNPEKIRLDIKEKKEKQIVEMGMNPLTNLIVCAGLYDGFNEPQTISIEKATHENEKLLIESLWKIFEKYDHFITFNGRSFDLRCIHLHGIIHGIRPSINIDKGKYNRGNHTDLREILAGPEMFAKGKMDFFCHKFLGTGKMEGIDGSMVQEYFNMGLHDDIAKYCEDDAVKTFRLYEKVEKAGLLD